MKFGTFDPFRRTCTFDISYDRSDLSFSQLYFNMFINLAGQKREDRIRLRLIRNHSLRYMSRKRLFSVKLKSIDTVNS